LALSPEAIAHLTAKATKKVRTKKARLVQWDEIKDNPPKELKILPIAAIPHKSKDFCSILDLSFRLHLATGGGARLCQWHHRKNGSGGRY
jgi:hypothetical protein